MKNVYKVKFLCWLAMLMVGCPSIHRPSVCLSARLHTPSCFSQRPPTARLSVPCRFDRRLPVYLSARLPILYCFSRHPPSTRHRLERQHAQRDRRPGTVDWTNHTKLAVCYYPLVSHTPPPTHMPPPVFATTRSRRSTNSCSICK